MTACPARQFRRKVPRCPSAGSWLNLFSPRFFALTYIPIQPRQLPRIMCADQSGIYQQRVQWHEGGYRRQPQHDIEQRQPDDQENHQVRDKMRLDGLPQPRGSADCQVESPRASRTCMAGKKKV